MKRNHHQIAAGVSAYTWREDDGWYSEIASDEPGDAGTDPEGPFDTEADALSAAKRTHRQLTQVRADIAEEVVGALGNRLQQQVYDLLHYGEIDGVNMDRIVVRARGG